MDESKRIEFKKLESVKDKLDFWENVLHQGYCAWSIVDKEKYKDFFIHTSDPEEIEMVNRNIIKTADTYFLKRYNEWNHPLIIKYEALIKEFKKKHERAITKDGFIEREIKKVDDLIQDKKKKNPDHDSRQANIFFIHGFETDYYEDQYPEISSRIMETFNLININNGTVYSQYLKYLQALKEGNDKEKVLVTPLRTQLAILDLIGILEVFKKFENNSKAAELLSILLNGNADNIRKHLSTREIGNDELRSQDLNKIKILNRLAEIFTDLNQVEIAQKIRNQLDK